MNDTWHTKRLEDVADVRVSNVDKKSLPAELPVRLCNYMDIYTNDYVVSGLSFMSATATRIEIEKFGLRLGDVMITKDSETPDDIGVSAVVVDEIDNLVCGYHLALIRPKGDEIHPVYLAKQLATERASRYFGVNASGSTRFGLSIGAIQSIELPIPDLPEQAKIAEVLSTVDRAIEQTEALIAKQQRIKTGLMQDLLTRGIDEYGNFRSEATHAFKDSPLGRIPVEWEVGGFINYVLNNAGIKPGPFGSSLTKDIYVNSGYRVYGQEQVIGGSLDIGDYYISARKYRQMAGFAVQEGDVLISLVGTIGNVLIIPELFQPGIINPRLLRFRPHSKHCDPKFLKALLLSQPIRLQLDTFATGGTMPVLSGAIIRKLQVVNLSIDEQDRIVLVIDKVEAALHEYASHLNKLRSLKIGLMQDLLTGQRRVTALLTEERTMTA